MVEIERRDDNVLSVSAAFSALFAGEFKLVIFVQKFDLPFVELLCKFFHVLLTAHFFVSFLHRTSGVTL